MSLHPKIVRDGGHICVVVHPDLKKTARHSLKKDPAAFVEGSPSGEIKRVCYPAQRGIAFAKSKIPNILRKDAEGCKLCKRENKQESNNPKYDIVAEAYKKMAIEGFTDWEGEVILAVENLLEVDTSDAQGIIMGQEMKNPDLLITAFKKGTSPEAMAKILDKLSTVKNPSMIPKVGDRVHVRGEGDIVYIVKEVNGDRVFVEAQLPGWTIKPVGVELVSDLIPVSTSKNPATMRGLASALIRADRRIWKQVRAVSGSDFTNNIGKQKKYVEAWAEELPKILKQPGYRHLLTANGGFTSDVFDALEDQNYHTLNELLVRWGLFPSDHYRTESLPKWDLERTPYSRLGKYFQEFDPDWLNKYQTVHKNPSPQPVTIKYFTDEAAKDAYITEQQSKGNAVFAFYDETQSQWEVQVTKPEPIPLANPNPPKSPFDERRPPWTPKDEIADAVCRGVCGVVCEGSALCKVACTMKCKPKVRELADKMNLSGVKKEIAKLIPMPNPHEEPEAPQALLGEDDPTGRIAFSSEYEAEAFTDELKNLGIRDFEMTPENGEYIVGWNRGGVMSNPHYSLRIERLVRKMNQQYLSGDKKGAERTRALINKITGPKTIPSGLTKKELRCPKLLARIISAAANIKKKQGAKVKAPWAVARAQFKDAPCGNPVPTLEELEGEDEYEPNPITYSQVTHSLSHAMHNVMIGVSHLKDRSQPIVYPIPGEYERMKLYYWDVFTDSDRKKFDATHKAMVKLIQTYPQNWMKREMIKAWMKEMWTQTDQWKARDVPQFLSEMQGA